MSSRDIPVYSFLAGVPLGLELSPPQYYRSVLSPQTKGSLLISKAFCIAPSFFSPLHILKLEILSPCLGRQPGSTWVPSPCPVT